MAKSQMTTSAKETQKIAAEFARQILRQNLGSIAKILALHGDLGAGKTTFLQGFASGLGIEETVNSPTFVIMKRFAINSSKFKNFYHFDCYRLESPEEILELGFEEITKNPENIVAIEWAEKISNLLPENIISINFIHKAGDNRELSIDGWEL